MQELLANSAHLFNEDTEKNGTLILKSISESLFYEHIGVIDISAILLVYVGRMKAAQCS